MPVEFDGLLEKERKVIEVKGTNEAVKEVVMREVGRLRGETKGVEGAMGASV